PAFDMTQGSTLPARPAFDMTQGSTLPARPAFDVIEVTSTPARPAFDQVDQIYLDTAGLVLVWPFLGTFFERFEWLFDKKTFIDETARARAVLLVQYLATLDPEPPEYRLPLAKVLCGLPLDDVFVVDTEVTEVEAKEAADLLMALLDHAKTFGEISIADFRDAFLLRRGILSTRDGSWLLRVERTPYDVVLQRLPWPSSWVRLPWMEAPLAVEWLR
ncbi:MAG TPA: contractile injection system tape measure protein, partial [Polyangium sp.]|nr:contractile injection system tape measure protein [Polyangium sp.]